MPRQANVPVTTVPEYGIKLSATTTSTQSAAIPEHLFIVWSDVNFYLEAGDDPVATNTSFLYPAGQVLAFYIDPTQKVAVLRGGDTDGTVNIGPAKYPALKLSKHAE